MKSCLVAAVCGLLLAVADPAFALLVSFIPTAEQIAARKEQAAAGDRYAQAEVADWYFHGLHGLRENREEAAILYRKSADQGYVQAQIQIAKMYEFGEGVRADHDAAVAWIRRAMTLDRGAAQFIALRYRNGYFAPRDSRKAVEWYLIAAEAGYLGAQNAIGEIYELDLQDYPEAAKWYRRVVSTEAARVEERAVAMDNLARLYMFGRGVPQDYAQAVKLYRDSMSAGYRAAPYGLALLYEQGHGVEQDTRRALELYYDVAPSNNEARDRMFLVYDRDLQVPPGDDAAAIAWYRHAAQKGDARARAGLGLRYKFGKGVRRDWGIAYALFELAARSSPRGAGNLPDFRRPARVMEERMTPAMKALVTEMAKPGNFLNALDRAASQPAE